MDGNHTDAPDFERCTSEGLSDAIGQLHGIEATVRMQLLRAVAVVDRRESWRADGAS
jgi:hypothetical protein